MINCIMVLGADGYIGNAIVQRLLTYNYNVIGIDNFSRRFHVEKQQSKSAIKHLQPIEKIKKIKEQGYYVFQKMDIAKEPENVNKIIERYKPDTIINLAHMPSGPWSMIDENFSSFSLMNNIIGTNSVLWSIKKHCPDCHYITIGSTGEYDHYNNIDIEEGYFQMEWKGRQSNEMIFPRRPGSVYHVSKVSSTYLIDLLAKSWGLHCTDIMQSIVFGAYTDDIKKSEVYSRFDVDECFGTVLNRFICQAKSNTPLTIYGHGEHKRGFLSLNDCVQALMIAVKNKPVSGHVQVWNQLSEWYSINEIAKMVQTAGKQTGLDVKTTKIKTPRNEKTVDHYYNYKTDVLKGFGYKPTRTIPQEIKYCLDLVEKRNFTTPKITWK